MKILRRTLLFLLVLTISLISFIFPVSAQNAVISFSNNSPSVGQTVTVTVKISANIDLYSAVFEVNYNSEVLEFQSANGCPTNSAGGGTISAAPALSGKNASYQFVFKAIKAGSSTVSVSGGAYGADSDVTIGASANMTVKDASKSDNANLSSLRPTSGTLSPRFSAATTGYTVTVPKNVETCNFSAQPADSGAKFTIDPADGKLKIGKNTFVITVTAASGAQKKYTVVVTRTEEEEPVGEDDPYEAQIGDTKYTLATDLTGVLLPNGFTPSTADYLGKEVAVATDKNNTFTLYYLQQKDAEGAKFVPYLLKSDQFIKVPCVTFGNNTYIITEFPDGVVPPSDTYETTLSIGGNSVIAYRKENGDPDFYYLYCFYNDSFGVYRYDQKEDVLQRNPEFLLTESLEPVAEDTAETAAPKPFTERFSALSSGAKIILILLLLAALIFVTLLVFAYLTLMRSRKEKMSSIEENMAFGDQPDDFDQVQVESDDTPHTEEVSPDEEE